MPRKCFVIMPFSSTASCSKEQWTRIFEEIIKPSIEGAGLDYECKRSEATRGNVVGAILQDINDSHVVLADLTDRNANVFYELGVRHALKDRSILIAQKREDIPFDLHAYANHVYNWQTPEGIKVLSERMKKLLTEIDNNPERPDNPVSDFLKVHPRVEAEPVPETSDPSELAVAQYLVGKAAEGEGIDIQRFVDGLVQRGRPQAAKTIMKLTRAELTTSLNQIVESFDERDDRAAVTQDKIYERAIEYVSEVEPIIKNIEDFGLACIEKGWKPGVGIILKLSEPLISASKRPKGRRGIRFADGAPSLMAWRVLCLCGTKALNDDEFDMVSDILRKPMEVKEASGRFSNRSLTERRDLFFPEAFLGNANIAMKYMDGLWDNNQYLSSYFDSNEHYQFALAKFFILVVLAASWDKNGHPLYPGFRRLKQASEAMSSFTSRIFGPMKYSAGILSIIGVTRSDLEKGWAERVQLINNISSSGGWPPDIDDVLFPEKFGEGL